MAFIPRSTVGLLSLLFTCHLSIHAAEPPSRETVLQGLVPDHPRLLARAEDFQRLAAICAQHESAGRWRAALQEKAVKLLRDAPVHYEIPDGKRLLSVSRRAKDRLLLLGLMYRLTADPRFAKRAWSELDAVTRFKDWNPSHFLDTAEMTFAVAIGLDWLHDAWTPQQRAQLQQAIIDKGLNRGLEVYRKQRGWSRAVHNWNQVCNGGMGVGALAIADQEPVVASEVLQAAVHSLPLAMHAFRPDGGWAEGPGYWRYATEYNVYFLAALQTALGRDFGMSQMPGFQVTGDFPLHFTSPTGWTFNYADAHDSWRGASQLFWLATRFQRPAYAAAQLPYAAARTSALDLLWGARWLVDGATGDASLPLDRLFKGVDVVTLRGTWEDPSATFVGFKGGDNRVNHGHLDLGSFVLDALGQRWAVDLGPDDYNLPEYFGSRRWSYYRNSTAGHNTLWIDQANQLPTAQAPITGFASTSSWAGAIADLSAAYPTMRRVLRGVALLDRRRVLVQDEVQGKQRLPVRWQMHTTARVSLEGRQALLAQGGQTLVARLLEPADAEFAVAEVKLASPQDPLRDVRKLSVTIDANPDARIVVLFDTHSPLALPPAPRALADWPVAGP